MKLTGIQLIDWMKQNQCSKGMKAQMLLCELH